MKLSFHAWLPALLLAALCATQMPARAGEAEDCAGQMADKIEPACNAVINDASRPADDRLKAAAASLDGIGVPADVRAEFLAIAEFITARQW